MYNSDVFSLLKMVREDLYKSCEKLEVYKIADVENKYFPNTIHWQLGHILTTFENILDMVGLSAVDLGIYNTYFQNGTNHRNWDVEKVPSLDNIFSNLNTSVERAEKTDSEIMNKELQEPIVGCTTLKEVYLKLATHFSLHQGKIEEMARIINTNK